jgi:hypothetical protein
MLCVVLAFACSQALAQKSAERVEDSKKPGEKSQRKGERVQREPRRPASQPSPAELQQRKLEEQRRAQRRLEEREPRDERRLERQRQDKDPRRQRARERTRDDPPVNQPHRVSPDSQPLRGVPSPAQQQQRGAEIERGAVQPDDGRRVRCHAQPVCRGGGGYGGCRGVESTYAGNLPVSRADIVRQCVSANTPDTCNCAAQCSRVAQCSNF